MAIRSNKLKLIDNSTGFSRVEIIIKGIVQGVGFRPFIYNLALKYGLNGTVSNSESGVIIHIEGIPHSIKLFISDIETKAPPISKITDITTKPVFLTGESGFTIISSSKSQAVTTLISPDVAVCPDCLNEMFDPNDRRYRYPFINCTNCGPRFTIIESIPYDRPSTSMKHFNLCPECQKEYDDPANRRFHAQPNACWECGPQVTLFKDSQNQIETNNPISKSIELLKKGEILAIKGLGGFHLAVDAQNESAIQKLRERKGREEKPLALMAKNIAAVEALCEVSDNEKSALQSISCPIVLLKRGEIDKLAPSIASGNDRYGIILPYTPLHHLLLAEHFQALVMTSANFSEEPICIDNQEAFDRLAQIADYFLIHNRDIYLRSDDSIVIQLADDLRVIRRSRGYAPQPIFLESTGPTVLGVGAELKNTVCLLKNKQAFLSQHIGNLENLEAHEFFKLTIKHFQEVFESKPELIIHDSHPQYLSTRWAKSQNQIPLLSVQHHHAHMASVMAEHRLDQPVIGIIMDGTGYGTDETIWGGEILIGDFNAFRRFAYFEPLPLPGGNAAIKAPWRTAVSYLYSTFGKQVPDLHLFNQHHIEPIIEMLEKNINSPLTSSCGRLFDAVAALSGGKQNIKYEAQAAIEFMQKFQSLAVRPFSYILDKGHDHWKILIQPIIRSVVRAIQNGLPIETMSSRFHKTLIHIFQDIALEARIETGINCIVLSGGVFQNQVLVENLIPVLAKSGFQVYSHSSVPTNDGGIALGQVMIGRKFLVKN